MKIILLTQDGCSPCHMVKNYLNENDARFEEINVSLNHGAIEEYNVMSTPVTVLIDDDDEIIRVNGFSPSELDTLMSQVY